MSRRCRVAALLAAGLASACAAPDPARFPRVPLGSDEAVLATLAARMAPLRSIQGVITMLYEGPEHTGTFDMVASYTREPRRLRLTAFKDVVVTSRDIFDLILTPDGYSIDFQRRDEDEVTRKRGPLAAFPADVPELAGFHLAGEALFLPGFGSDAAGARVVERNEQVVLVETPMPGGARALWTLDPATLEVVRGAVLGGDGARRVALRYGDYLRFGAAVVPGSVQFHDPSDDTTITIAVHQVDLDVPLEAADFELPSR